jgi:hypothetical protein
LWYWRIYELVRKSFHSLTQEVELQCILGEWRTVVVGIVVRTVEVVALAYKLRARVAVGIGSLCFVCEQVVPGSI